jgi:aryl-alcohol dehydrogenase-like predicted oxidoreductase
MDRRELCRTLAALPALAALPLREVLAVAPPTPMLTRPIGRSGATVPVIGMGSSNTFDVGASEAERAPLLDVLRELASAGGSVIDTSPMYGRSEAVLGDVIAKLGLRPKLWIATKVWTDGREAGLRQIEASMRELQVDTLELLQIHNLRDWRVHLPTLHALRDAGKVRFIGLTHYRADAHAELERVLAAEKFDFVQLNYSLAEPEAAQRLLPFCREHGIAVMVNRPFADGAMFAQVRDRPLPPVARDVGAASWGQYFLKWIVAHPAVTCVIPATTKAKHMRDNALAGFGPLPDARQREQMERDWRA